MDKRKKGSSTELRLMIVGSSGPPQFLLTNAILGREEFPKDTTCISDSRKNIGELAGRRIAVINGPNIYDKDISGPKRKRELRRSKCLCIPGPHAFLVAFDMEDISLNDMRAPKLLRKRFGRHCMRRCMVLLAYDGNLEGAALEKKVQKTDWYLRELIEKYNGRFHVFSKNWRDRSRDRELLQKIERMVASLGGGYFSSSTFQKAEDFVKKEEKRLRRKRSAEIEKHGLSWRNTSRRTRMYTAAMWALRSEPRQRWTTGGSELPWPEDWDRICHWSYYGCTSGVH
ncbi:GTPase IMAP family member 1 [Notolabrus celidotus]|uniref:GTPase IMAP family member 1 n=1 Tax=Notolabrus celidotus TaxID=1203425 RepID=UPI00149044BF|nr:GTPase IMAP family member 1 [Notolabrus celidotus]